jgi:sugar/nucleoside kinase (ribokinase family)
MSLLVTGSVALDTIETPHGRAEDALGGSATFFSAAASLFHPVQLVGVVGHDFPMGELGFLAARGVDLDGLERAEGSSFRWSGRYSPDMNHRETLDTQLGVFAEFQPSLPRHYRASRWVFLGNIHPELQLDVLTQLDSPRLVACDTMNYWIQNTRDELLALLRRIDLLLVNDSEARELSGEHNLLQAARWIQRHGPELVVIKKGEHGAILFTPDLVFFAPGYPCEQVLDPTGAGDAFAGGFMGYLARADSVEPDELRRAMIHGSVTGSFAVERFGPERFLDLTAEQVTERVHAFRTMTAFEFAVPVRTHA